MVTITLNEFFIASANKFVELFLAPINYPEMFWILVPLVVTVVLMEMYFTRYPREELGYHATLENTVFLLFVAVDLIRYLIVKHDGLVIIKVILIAFIVFYSIILAIFDFFHKLPRNVAFKTSSKTIIGFTAYICIILVYSDILTNITPLSLITTVLSVFILFWIFRFFLYTIHVIGPVARDDVEGLLTSVENDLRAAAKEANVKNNKKN